MFRSSSVHFRKLVAWNLLTVVFPVFFDNIFWFFSFSCIVRLFSCFNLVFSYQHARACFPSLTLSLIISISLCVLFVKFLIHVFLFGFYMKIPILFQTSFGPVLISLLSFVMLPVGIFANNFFIFLVSTFILFQSWFLRDINVVFFSIMILFIIYEVILSFCFCGVGFRCALIFSIL